jgi:DNA-binding PadR family transcriptional regulator
MVFRKPGTLLPLEQSVLEIAVRAGADGTYGFALAQELAAVANDRRLVAHGTMYKALDRLSKNGLLLATWEDPELAQQAGRPRRRMYRITGLGERALAGGYLHIDGEPEGGRWPGESPA